METKFTMATHMRGVYWRCRRGLLELDLLLIPFLKEVYPTLSTEMQKQFETLLEESDPELLQWCLGGQSAPETFKSIVEKIQQYAKTQHFD